MPVAYNLPEYTNADSIEDINKYNKLPFYLASLEAKMFPQWQVFNSLFGKIPWKPNMGKTLRGVRAEPTPVGAAVFYPQDIDQVPNKNVYETLETSEDTNLKWHDFDSKQFHFIPSFQDFREGQIEYNHKDIVRQIAIMNDIFIRTVMLQKTPNIFITGNSKVGEKMLISAPAIPSGTTISQTTVDNQGKNTAFFEAAVSKVGGNLSLATIDYLVNVFRDDLAAPFFEGTVNTPKDNDLVKGRYVLIGSSEAYQVLKWDPDFSAMRNINLSIVNDGFRGSIFDEVTWKTERYPMRFKADGTLVTPELYDVSNNRTRPDPAYIDAPFELAWLVGADAFKTIKVGPPPKEFSGGKKMDAAKFYSMRWNGEVQLTDQVLVKYSDGTLDTNVRGRFLKLISSLIFGAIPVNAYNCLPILYKRKRAPIK